MVAGTTKHGALRRAGRTHARALRACFKLEQSRTATVRDRVQARVQVDERRDPPDGYADRRTAYA